VKEAMKQRLQTDTRTSRSRAKNPNKMRRGQAGYQQNSKTVSATKKKANALPMFILHELAGFVGLVLIRIWVNKC